MGGETKVVETKVELKTAVYKVHVHCGQCARDIETQFTEFHGVQEVKLDAGSGKVTVRGIGFDEEKLRVKVSQGCRKRVEYIAPPKDIITEIKSKKEELKIITMKVPLHCPDCAVRVREILLEHKSIYAAKTDFGSNTCVIEGVIEEKKLTEYIYQRIRKECIIEKVETTVRIVEEKIEVKKKKKEEEVVKVVEEVTEVVKEKIKEVVAPYFIPCTHPHFVDYSHRCGGGGGCGDGCSPYGGGGGGYGYGNGHGYGGGCGGGYGYGNGHGYGGGCGSYSTHSELRGYQDTSFLHCSHPVEFLSHDNPNGCSVM